MIESRPTVRAVPRWYDAFAKPDLVAPGHHLVSDGVVGSTLYESTRPTRRREPSATERHKYGDRGRQRCGCAGA